jgi:hypothetical protein
MMIYNTNEGAEG